MVFSNEDKIWIKKFVFEGVHSNMVFSNEDKILIKKFVFEGVHSKEVDRRISREKLDKA